MAGIDRDLAQAIQRRALHDFVRLCAGGASGSRLIELPGGVAGAVVPAVPRRSIVNSVTYDRQAAVVVALDDLAAAYERAGVAAWTVWTHAGEGDAVAALERAGHSLDGEPVAMVLDLEQLADIELGDLDWDADADLALLGALNDEAYGPGAGPPIAPALQRPPDGLDLRIHRARIGGEPACVLATIDHPPAPGAAGPDCGIYLVATPERFRRRGLATRLLAAALAEARERGCATSSLQASSSGERVYRSLGYRSWFRLRMLERRRG